MLATAFPILPNLCLILLETRSRERQNGSGATLKEEGNRRRMAKYTAEHGISRLDVTEMRTALARKIAAHAPFAGEHPTGVPGLVLFRRTAPSPCYRATYEPSL